MMAIAPTILKISNPLGIFSSFCLVKVNSLIGCDGDKEPRGG